MSTVDRPLRRIVPPERLVVHATDLGGVGVLKHGDLYLLTDPFGDIHRDSRGLGLYRGDTRVLSCSVLRVDGARPTLLRGDIDENFRSTIQLTNAEVRHDPGDKIAADRSLARQSLGFTRARAIGGAFHERLTVANFTEHPEVVTIDLALGVDAADIFEVRGYTRAATGYALPLTVVEDRVAFGHVGRDGMLRRTQVAFAPAEVLAVDDLPEAARVPGAAVVLRWRLEVEPGGRVEREWTIWADEAPLDPARPDPHGDADRRDGATHRRRDGRGRRLRGLARRDGRDRLGQRAVRPAHRPERGRPAAAAQRRPAAGRALPRRRGPRGSPRCSGGTRSSRPTRRSRSGPTWLSRRSTSWPPARRWSTIPAPTPSPARSSTRSGPARWPGPASCRSRPTTGASISTPLWLILLGETHDWTGDDALVDRLWPNALAALSWIDRFGDLDGDGFVEYRRRAELGLINQGWKDSTDAIRDRDGRTAVPPVALAEVQGYVHDAKRRMARLARHRAEHELADRLERRPTSSGPGSTQRSGSPTEGSSPWPSTGPSGRWTLSPRTWDRRSGAGSSTRPAPRPSSAA